MPPDDLVMIPGLLLKADLFAAQMPALKPYCRTILVPDHALHRDLDAIARDILRRASDRFALCGLSMGGYIAFEILRQAPERVSRLALLNTAATADTPDRTAKREVAVGQARTEGLAVVSNQYYPSWVHPSRHNDKALQARVVAMAEATGIHGFARQQAAIASRPDSRPLLKRIVCPTIVIVGRQDAVTPVEEAEIIARGIPGSALTVIERCGHLSTMEQPDIVSQALIRWLID